MASFLQIRGEMADAPKHMLSRYIFEGKGDDYTYLENVLQEGNYILSHDTSSSRIVVKAQKFGQNQLLITPILVFSGSQSSNTPTGTPSPPDSPHLASIRPDSSPNMPTRPGFESSRIRGHAKNNKGKKRPVDDSDPDPERSSNKRASTIQSTIPSTSYGEIPPKTSSESATALIVNRVHLLLESDEGPQRIQIFFSAFLAVDILNTGLITEKTYDDFYNNALEEFKDNEVELKSIHMTEALYAPVFHNAFKFDKSGIIKTYKSLLLPNKVDISKTVTLTNDKLYDIIHYRLFPFPEKLATAKPDAIMGIHVHWVEEVVNEEVKDAKLASSVIDILTKFCEICNANLYFPWFIGECKAKDSIDVAVTQLQNSLAAALAAGVEWIGEENLVIFGAAYTKNLVKLFVGWVEPVRSTPIAVLGCDKWAFKMKQIDEFLLNVQGMKGFVKRLIQIHHWGMVTRMEDLKNNFKAGIRKYIQERRHREDPTTSVDSPLNSFYHAPPTSLSHSQDAAPPTTRAPSVPGSPLPTTPRPRNPTAVRSRIPIPSRSRTSAASGSRISTATAASGRGLRDRPVVSYKE
ncbi:hypothetical protein GGR53DRAFT_468750 [Hypoxylon sp. FL1150]|nr:hypothetical protein GGR53DRAFT_468750 [Hypoxylon sp. FL1150]